MYTKTIFITKDTPGWEDDEIWRERIFIDGKEVTKIEVTTDKDRELQKKLEAYLLEHSRVLIDKAFLT